MKRFFGHSVLVMIIGFIVGYFVFNLSGAAKTASRPVGEYFYPARSGGLTDEALTELISLGPLKGWNFAMKSLSGGTFSPDSSGWEPLPPTAINNAFCWSIAMVIGFWVIRMFGGFRGVTVKLPPD